MQVLAHYGLDRPAVINIPGLVALALAAPVKPFKRERFGEFPFTARSVPAAPIRILSATIVQE
jgi:hypothetical protein